MNQIKKLKSLIIIGLAIFLQSCTNDDYKEIESDLLGNPNYITGVYTATVTINNIAQKSVQTSGLGGYLLGQYTQAPFGTKKASIIAQVNLESVNPTFGANSQSTENNNNTQENEKVTEVYLYIPFFTTSTSFLTDTEYALDSIYGNSAASFDVKVRELTYFLRDIDQNANNQIYYSDLDIENYVGKSLANEKQSISKKSITRYKFDDPSTTDDESKTANDVLAPGLRIALDKDFFQTKIIDKEGSDELSNLNLFKNYFRGINISASNFSQEIMMLLNMANAKIEIVYSYESGSDSNKKTLQSRYEMNVNGITVNLFDNSGQTINAENGNDVSRIYLSGGLGRNAELNLFTNNELAELKSKNVLITDASLFLYLDESVSYGQKPSRIFIYNAKTGAVLTDYSLDPTANASLTQNAEIVHLGALTNQNYYQIRLTNHISNIIKNNAENVPLGIVIASNVKNTTAVKYSESGNYKFIPVNTVATPLSAVIYGNSPNISNNKQIQFKINYTKAN